MGTPSKVGTDFQTLHEIVLAAKLNLNQGDWDYIVGGTETETTLRRNRRALDSVAFRPRVLRDVSQIDASQTFLGRKLRLPLMLAPVGSLEAFTPEGGTAAGKAAGEFGIAQTLSSVCQPGLEQLAQDVPDTLRAYQLYVRGDAAWIDDVVKQAIDNGYGAFCLTVDTDKYSRRERDIAKRNERAALRRFAPGREWQERLSWDYVKHFKDTFDLPLMLKGIATAEDAALACEHGVDYVYVSNHGGRQLDHGRGGLDVLPEVVKAVNGRARVIFDGGIVRGTDIVKAMALGAHMVAMGRMECIGLAAAGAAGLVRVLELLEHEVQIALGLLGVTSWETLDASYLHPAEPVTDPHMLSAFPLLTLDEGYV
ncbi:MAG TPA: alpha-hydroxy acid oxidase [bacterium]|nr:alpha-hydroxy acid oxidase [bacterium]